MKEANVNLEQLICSLLNDHPEGVNVREDIHKALAEQSIVYKDGKLLYDGYNVLTGNKVKEKKKGDLHFLKAGKWYTCIKDWTDDGWAKFLKGDNIQCERNGCMRDCYGLLHHFGDKAEEYFKLSDMEHKKLIEDDEEPLCDNGGIEEKKEETITKSVVWHKADSIPKFPCHLLCAFKNGFMNEEYFSKESDLRFSYFYRDLEYWAYADEVLPKKEC